MVSFFKMDSVEQLAYYLVKVKSHVRQNMLRDFYAHQHTEVADMFPVQVPLAEKERDNVPSKDVGISLKKRLKKSHLTDEALEMHADAKSDHMAVLDSDPIDYIKAYKKIEKSPIPEKKMNCLSNTEHKKCLPHEQFDMSESSLSATSHQINNVTYYKSLQPEKVNNEANFVSDLLGDTSILDDLFSNPTLRQPSTLPVRTPPQSVTPKSKHRFKDFWDILSEQNDESINRLTDLSVIKKVCDTSIVSSVAKKEKWNDSMWVSNEKFVWKRNQASNSERPSSSKSPNS